MDPGILFTAFHIILTNCLWLSHLGVGGTVGFSRQKPGGLLNTLQGTGCPPPNKELSGPKCHSCQYRETALEGSSKQKALVNKWVSLQEGVQRKQTFGPGRRASCAKLAAAPSCLSVPVLVGSVFEKPREREEPEKRGSLSI